MSKHWVVVLTCACLSACATAPEPDQRLASATAASRATVAEPASSTLPQEGASASADAAAAAAKAGFRAPAGYKRKQQGETTVYCKRETRVGTRFPTEYCFTEEQLRRIENSAASMRNDFSRQQRTCVGTCD